MRPKGRTPVLKLSQESARPRIRSSARLWTRIVAGLAAVWLAGGIASAQQTQLLWGDTHLHTSHSTDAYASGNSTLGPAEAYRYAKGVPVVHPVTGTRMRISRPLDFLVVADHSDYLGLQKYMQVNDPRLTATPEGRRLREIAIQQPASIFRMIFGANPEFSREQLLSIYAPVAKQPWYDEIDAAERYNEPGVFTAFAGWEWSPQPGNKNLHRVVFSPAGPSALRSFFPYSNLDSVRPEDLWAWLERTAKAIASDFIAIPHNSNMSAGLMFDMVDSDGRPISAEYARTRIRWEPVMEVTQVKGTSEVNPALSPNDEFAEFEIFRRLFYAAAPVPNAGDYARSALLRGLEIERNVGVNPYRFGMIGSSDIHTGMSEVAENNFGGAVARDIRPADRRAASAMPYPPNASARLDAWNLSASGLAAVWAKENTRESIAQAFKRKEVYATTGTRISLRVFGGFRFKPADAQARDLAAVGYRGGVPMGGDLTHAPAGSRPTLLIHAVKDPIGANLDRIQVVKGWIDAAGLTHEHVYDVAWSGNRKAGNDGTLPPVGNTVDLTAGSYKNSIGLAQLATVWTDPDFNPKESSFYYVRVLEIPTPRHQVYDALSLAMDPKDTGFPTTIQERAYSTPIWYIP
jgi:hypothetical protein